MGRWHVRIVSVAAYLYGRSKTEFERKDAGRFIVRESVDAMHEFRLADVVGSPCAGRR